MHIYIYIYTCVYIYISLFDVAFFLAGNYVCSNAARFEISECHSKPNIYTYIFVHRHVYTYPYIYISIYIYMYEYIYILIYTYVYIRTYIYIYIIYIHTHTHTHIYIYIYIYIFIYTPEHPLPKSDSRHGPQRTPPALRPHRALASARYCFVSGLLCTNQYHSLRTLPLFRHPTQPRHRPQYCAI